MRRRAAPTEGAQRAGAAALARVDHHQRPMVHTSQDAIRKQVKRELEAEAAALAAKEKPAEDCSVPVRDPACLSVSAVFFTCPLTGAMLTKSERDVHIKEAIFMRFEEDAVEASVMMVHTFNKDRDKVKAAVDIISKTRSAVWRAAESSWRPWVSSALCSRWMAKDEEFLVLPEQSAEALELMRERRDRLQRGEPVRAQLDRQPQAFRPSSDATRFELPPDFYNLTVDELKREQQQRSELVEKSAMLRTRAMREKEEQRERRKYNYTLLRVRLPDGTLLQGTFYAWDRVPALFQFVRESLVDGWQPFDLVAPGSQKLKETEDVALAEVNLVPAAVITLSWDAAVQADIAAAASKSPALLKPSLQETIKTLN
ncbi:hypothetical protein CRUP_033554 [Coryphaenoides rupestris]|nr:hypothetical protein CRUP_033554 [Coryphaenoides rupestris]